MKTLIGSPEPEPRGDMPVWRWSAGTPYDARTAVPYGISTSTNTIELESSNLTVTWTVSRLGC